MKQLSRYILVDDDSTSNLIGDYTIKRFNEHATTHLFTSPEEALRFIQNKEGNSEAGATVLFLDMNLHTMTGFEFLEKLMELKDDEITDQYRIYMLTSSIEDFSSQKREFPMIKGFLSKPLNLSYLQDIHLEFQNSSNAK